MNYKMISKSAVLSLVIVAASFAAPQKGTMKDLRDGKVYKTTKIGGLTWMAENLNYKMESSWCLNDDQKNCAKYGRLYSRISAKKACPNGWHLPEMLEIVALIREHNLKLEDVAEKAWLVTDAGKYLKSTNGWDEGNGMDVGGFSAVPSGLRTPNGTYSISCGSVGKCATFWISNFNPISTLDRVLPDLFFLIVEKSDDGNIREYSRGGAYYIRCLKDDEDAEKYLDSLKKQIYKNRENP